MSANAIDLFAGVNVPPPTADGQILTATAAGAAHWSNTIDAGGLVVTSGNVTANLGNVNAPLGNVQCNGPVTTTAAGITSAGVIAANGGVSSAGSAPVLVPAFANGTAAQLADLTRDYMVYLTVGTAGTAFILAIGPTAGVANTVIPSSAAASGEVYTCRLPAGWFLKWSATTATLAGQLAIGC